MAFQSNPYFLFQLVSGLITLGIGLYALTRPFKKRGADEFAVLMFGGSWWAFASAIQLVTPDPDWQYLWNVLTYIGIMVVPTAWFLLAVQLTGYGRARLARFERWLWAFPIILFLTLVSNDSHHLFFTGVELEALGRYVALKTNFGVLFYLHTAYSYALLVLGIGLLVVSLLTQYKRYGAQAYGLIVGVLAPLVGNAYFLFGNPPEDFPDPTPMIFTVTGVAFAWAIFRGRLLEVVPLARDVIVRQLSTGIIILDVEQNIRDINPAAVQLLGLTDQPYQGRSFPALVAHLPAVAARLLPPLGAAAGADQAALKLTVGAHTLEARVDPIRNRQDEISGWLVQLADISEQEQAEAEREQTQLTYRAVLDSLADSYFEADVNGVLTYVNQAFVRAVGLQRKEDLIGRHFRHITSRRAVRLVYDNFKRIFETHQAIDPFEFIYRMDDGSEYPSEIVVSPILEGGRAIGTRGIVRDISVRVKAEETLRQAKEAAEYRANELAAINRVAAKVSRSLNLPEVLQSVCEELTSTFPVRNAGIGLLTPDQRGLEIIAFHSAAPDEKSALGMVLPLEGNQASAEVIRLKRPVIIQDSQTDPRTTSVADISRVRGTRAIMIVPLLARGEAIGTIGLPAKDPNHVFSPSEIELVQTIASQIAAAVENARLHARTERALGVAERDLEIGRQIQSSFFPESIPRLEHWELVTHFDAARQVAGDFYDAFQFRGSPYTALIIADVCDKGVGAALFMVLIRSLLRAFSEITVSPATVSDQLANIVVNTNNFIARYHGKSNMFATLFFGILDPETGSLYYVNGGHEPPIILGQAGQITHRLMPTGPAVGLFPDLPFQVQQIRLEEGAVLLGFTDGSTDAKNAAGQQYSEDRLLEFVAQPWPSVFSLVFDLNSILRRHIGDQPQFDDITLIALRRQCGPARHVLRRPATLEVLSELRAFVEGAARHSGLSAEVIFNFKLVVDELCTNIIQYGYAGRPEGEVTLTFEVEAALARLSIEDDGQPFAPEHARAPDTQADWDEREAGGLGLFFVRELMDQVTYTRTASGRNLIQLEKRLDHSNPKEN